MSDPTPPGLDDDPLQINSIIAEAAAVQQDVQSLEAMTHAFEDDVVRYTEAFAQAWENSLQAAETELETWQAETADAQAALAAEPAPPAPNASAPRITPKQLEALKKRLNGAGGSSASVKTAATKKTPDPDA